MGNSAGRMDAQQNWQRHTFPSTENIGSDMAEIGNTKLLLNECLRFALWWHRFGHCVFKLCVSLQSWRVWHENRSFFSRFGLISFFLHLNLSYTYSEHRGTVGWPRLSSPEERWKDSVHLLHKRQTERTCRSNRRDVSRQKSDGYQRKYTN